MKFFIPILIVSFLVFGGIAQAQCDKTEAKNIIQSITDSGIASREDSGITVWYHWKGPWHSLGKDRQLRFISGLAGVEDCLRPGVTTRIRFAGKDVAKGNSGGVELLD